MPREFTMSCQRRVAQAAPGSSIVQPLFRAGRRETLAALRTLVFVLLSLLPWQAQADEFDSARFGSIVEDGMQRWHVPGMAVAVLRDGDVVFRQGFGTTAVTDGTPVDEHTLFANASTTKAMIVAGILMLADEGKLSLDDLAIRHLPELHFGDPSLSQQITLRDLLAHRTGLPSTDMWTFNQHLPLDEQIRRLRFVTPESAPRTRLIYQNTMYELAGLIIERSSGQPWDVFLTERLWRPLGMHETFASRGRIKSGMDHVMPHDHLQGQTRQVQFSFSPDLLDAAGSAWTSIHDMSLWAAFLLGGGITDDGERLISEAGMHEMFEPQQLATPEDFYPTVALTNPHWRTYALGWFQQDFMGRAIDFHTGSLSGLVAIFGLDRDAGNAVIVLANRDHAEIRHALLWEALDLTEASQKRDWNQEVFELYAKRDAEAAEKWRETERARLKGTRPRLPIKDYAGTYRSEVNGDISITAQKNDLEVSTARDRMALSHWHQDTFLLNHEDWQYGDLTVFRFATGGGVAAIELFGDVFYRVEQDTSD